MATKKKVSSEVAARLKALGLDPDVRIPCCSGALDILMVDDAGFEAEVENGAAISVGGLKVAKVIHLGSEFSRFAIPGIGSEGIDKTTNPWRIFVIPADVSSAAPSPLRPASAAKKSTKKYAKKPLKTAATMKSKTKKKK